MFFFPTSWDKLRDTSDFTDEELNDMLRKTTLYATIQLSNDAEFPDEYIISPRNLPVPSASEIAPRFPELTASQIEAIEADYHLGRQRVEALITECDLEKWFERVVMLEAANRETASAVESDS